MERNRHYEQLIRELITQRLRHNPHLLARPIPFPAGKDNGREGEQTEIRPVYGPAGRKRFRGP